MRRLIQSLSAALVLVALAPVLFQPYKARTVRAADLQEKCDNCLANVQARSDSASKSTASTTSPVTTSSMRAS